MDASTSFFTISIGESQNDNLTLISKDPAYVDVFHQTLPSGSLLETDDVIQQFLSSNEPLEEPDLNGPTTLHCEICQKKFDNAKKYYGHLRVHSKSKAWVCDKCPDQRFSTKQQLMKHSLIHKPLEKIWKCPQCPMVFEVLFRLQQHLFSKHLNYRPHKCDKCEKAFNKLSELKKHQLVHSDVKDHECPVCNRGFKDKSNLKRHFLKHTQEKPFLCTGCGTRFQQIASFKRHSSICTAPKKIPVIDPTGPTRFNYCRVCGDMFQYKSALIEHCMKEHSNTSTPVAEKKVANTTNKEEVKIEKHKSHTNTENKDVNDIVNDILSVEDEYSIVNTNTMSNQNEAINVAAYNKDEQDKNAIESNADNLMHIELFKDMNQLHNLEDELFYNDIDFDSFHQNQVFNGNDNENAGHERIGEILFDFPDAGRSMDHEFMNALCQVRAEHFPDELLNVSEDNLTSQAEHFLGNHVSMNECATIFETDVDLEASTNLAANLNQLIGENSVHYVSTEDDDTFIISLDNGIDAERLTDILNISEVNCKEDEDGSGSNDCAEPSEVETAPIESIVLKIPETETVNVKETDLNKQDGAVVTVPKVKMRKQVLFICRVCKKIFHKRDNYRSHLATHDYSLRRHKCEVCGERFGYKSTLNKHVLAQHTPRVDTAHSCSFCDKHYTAAWMLRDHVERDHEGKTPYECNHSGCGRKFYKKSDLVTHTRLHTGERPYRCDSCDQTYQHRSHIVRHLRRCPIKNKKEKVKNINNKPTNNKKKLPQEKMFENPTVMKIRTDKLNCDVLFIH